MVDYFTERVISQPGTFYHKISLDLLKQLAEEQCAASMNLGGDSEIGLVEGPSFTSENSQILMILDGIYQVYIRNKQMFLQRFLPISWFQWEDPDDPHPGEIPKVSWYPLAKCVNQKKETSLGKIW